jgi:c-di-GMP-binding flagellar brake protein YcgR
MLSNPRNRKPLEPRRPRVELGIMIRFKKKGTENYYYAEILDISEGGLKIHSKHGEKLKPFKEEDLVYFETQEEFYKINGVGKIKWLSADKDMVGVDFVEIKNDSQIKLKQFIEVCA